MVLLLSTYDLGRQPFGLASPAAWLRRAGLYVMSVDLSRDKLDGALVSRASLIGFYLPMHTATRLALPVIDRIRALNPAATLCAYGLYAPLNEELLRQHGVTQILGPEFEADLLELAGSREPGPPSLGRILPSDGEVPPKRPPAAKAEVGSRLARLTFLAPDRAGLPPPSRYATLQMPDGSRRIVGSTDATRGCKHRCRHCPIVPVYDGQFRVIPVEVVLADIRAQVTQGIQHVTFADPDFFNGPTHARRIVEALHAEWPSLSYDCTIKVEHLLRHRELLPVLVSTGCVLVTSAVESVDDVVLEKLEKGHTRADFVAATRLCAGAGLTLAPTFVAFTPWTTIDGYADLLDTVASLGLAGHVAPVQWGIRLLVTWQSRLLDLPDIRAAIGPFDPKTLTFPWRHADPRVDRLQTTVMDRVGLQMTTPRLDTFATIRALLDEPPYSGSAGAARPGTRLDPLPSRAAIPYLNEPWYC